MILALKDRLIMEEIDPEAISECNGKNGKPVYIAHEGNIFDVSGSALWKGGIHMRRHQGGTDLTEEFRAAPHGTEVLQRYPQVGIMAKKKVVEQELPALVKSLLVHFPMLRRHPHPMTVHFPIVFMFSATCFTLLYLITGYAGFESTAFNCLGAGILFTPAAMATGYFTWWLNYGAKPMRPVTRKLYLSFFLLVIESTAFVWRLVFPDVLTSFHPRTILYLILICMLTPIVVVIGWFGATLTFPFQKE